CKEPAPRIHRARGRSSRQASGPVVVYAVGPDGPGHAVSALHALGRRGRRREPDGGMLFSFFDVASFGIPREAICVFGPRPRRRWPRSSLDVANAFGPIGEWQAKSSDVTFCYPNGPKGRETGILYSTNWLNTNATFYEPILSKPCCCRYLRKP